MAGDSGGAADALLDGANGHVVDGRDPAAVAARCAELLLDPALAAKFGECGRAWVAERGAGTISPSTSSTCSPGGALL